MGGTLVVTKVIYYGDKYTYTSPDFGIGLQIIEASNGAGKTTFSALICYGLGMYVRQFDFKEKVQVHKEIFSDRNNYVLLGISINNEEFELTRYFSKDNRNTIYIKGEHGFQDSYPVYRNQQNKSDEIFSDWLLSKLGIEVCEIYQGTKKFKINFSDLFRLIHYDQNTPPDRIYKEHRTDNNFVSDSVTIRRVIFELLVGHQFSEYHALLGQFHKAERQRETNKATLKSYMDLAMNMGYNVTQLNSEELSKKLKGARLQVNRLELYRNDLKERPNNSALLSNQVLALRKELVETESKYGDCNVTQRQLRIELQNLLQLKEDIIREVTQIKKIILAHEELNLFSPDTCPVCLREVKRAENHCICGAPLEESQYERFFYSSDEYLDILKSKQKSVETVDIAIQSCQEELSTVETQMVQLDVKRSQVRTQLREVDQTIHLTANDSELVELNDKLLEVKELIQHLEQQEKVYDKYAELNKAYLKAEDDYSTLSQQLRRLESDMRFQTERQIAQFDNIYTEYMKSAEKDVTGAVLNEDYMPVINNGEYRQASSNVAKRLMYYLTLLKMAVKNEKMPFPRFLLIDTPENLGIDKVNLDECLMQILNLTQEASNFQVILTTGLGKYPPELKPYVTETLTEDKKLLIQRG